MPVSTITPRMLDPGRLIAAVAGAFVLLVGTVVLVGWALELKVLTNVLPGFVSMKPNTAFSIAALGFCLLVAALPGVSGPRGVWVARIMALLVFAIGALVLLGYLAGWSVGIDQLLFAESADPVATAAPGRMAPESAMALLLCSAGVLLATFPGRSPRTISQAFGVLAALTGLWWLMRYSLGRGYTEPAIYTAMALQTAVALVALGSGLVALGVRDMFQVTPNRVEITAMGVPWALLLLAGIAVQLLWSASVERSGNDARQLFEREVSRLRVQIEGDVRTHELLLRGTAAAVESWLRIDRSTWRDFVERLEIGARYPAIQGLGYVRLLGKGELAPFERARRREGLDTFSVWPESARTEYSAITYLEPLEGPNRRALGYDMQTEETRRDAMHRARDSGAPTLTGKVHLLQDAGTANQGGLLLFMPLYRQGARPVNEVQRRAALVGYVYGLFRATVLIGTVMRDSDAFAVEVHDGAADGERTLLVRGGGVADPHRWPLFVRNVQIPVGGRSWTLHVTSLPSMEAGIDRRLPVALLFAGCLAALSIFGVASMLAEQRLAADRISRQSESALRENETTFRAMIDAVQDYMIILLDPDGRIATWNSGAARIKGYFEHEVIGRHFSLFYPREEIESGKPATLLVQARRDSVSDEGWRLRKDGSRFWASVVISPLRSADGVLSGFVKVTHDNTVLMEAEQSLRNANVALELRVRERTRDLAIANERYELAVRGSSDGLWDWDVGSNAVYFSPRFQELLGFVPGTGELEQSFAAFETRLHADDKAAVLNAVDMHLRNREPYDIEYRLRTYAGDYRWYRARGQAVWDVDGKPLRMAGSITDVTERRQVEESLRDSEERLRSTLDNALDAFIAIDEDGRILEWNRQAAATFGWSREEALGKRLSGMIIPTAMRRQHEDGMQRLRATGEQQILNRRQEFPALHRDGHQFPVELSIIEVTVGGHRIYSASLRDISARRKAEKALRQSEAQLQAIIDNSPAVIYLKDLDGRYLLVNRQFEKLFNVTHEATRGKTDHDLFPREMADEYRKNDRSVIERGAVVEAEESAPVDGILRTYLSAKFPLLDGAGKLYATCGISTDITGRKRAEEQLKAFTGRLEESNRELEEFARVASHDLQEPLRKVTSFAERLATKYAGALDEQGRDYIARMTDATRRMGRLIEDLLNYSRLTTRAQPFRTVDMNVLVREVISDLEVRIEESGAQVDVGELPAVNGDRMQLQQLMQNLIGNALKFLRPDSEPCVRVAGSVDESDDGEAYVLSVSDNGIGFDPQDAERIFGVFQRLHGRTEYEGSGVGLAICRKIATRHGGTISAAGVPGKGATFTVRLPISGTGGLDS